MQLQVVYPEALELPRLFRKSNLELIPRKKSFGCRVLMLVLVQGRPSCNGTVEACGDDGMYPSDRQTSWEPSWWPAVQGNWLSLEE